jgi:hypothetical protein
MDKSQMGSGSRGDPIGALQPTRFKNFWSD